MAVEAGSHPRGWVDARRWYTVDCYTTRDAALAQARRFRRADAFGKGRAFRVRKSTNDAYCVEHASGLSKEDRERGGYFNRKAMERRPLGL